jgi:hypothetical protein
VWGRVFVLPVIPAMRSDEAGLVYVSILGGEIRMVLMSHDCPVAQLTDATTLINRKSVALQ